MSRDHNSSSLNSGDSQQSSLSSSGGGGIDRDDAKYVVHDHKTTSKAQWVSLCLALGGVVSFTLMVFFLVCIFIIPHNERSTWS
jgi:hypothetical protein